MMEIVSKDPIDSGFLDLHGPLTPPTSYAIFP